VPEKIVNLHKKQKVMDSTRMQIVENWLKSSDIEAADKEIINNMMNNDPSQLEDAFYTDLEFGTGGLRGVMGIGTNRMNKYTVGMATQGLANYMKQQFQGQELSAVIARDPRKNSDFFTNIAAFVLSANGIKVWLFDDIMPTPVLSFAVRELKCNAGIMITASHNPKEYNGYKVYWNDGGQLVHPHDENVIAQVQKITDPSQVNFHANSELIQSIDSQFIETYYERLKTVSVCPELIQKYSHLKIVYSPLHGTGYKVLPEAMKRFGFNNVIDVYPQNIPDGNFPTVVSPNPEEKAGLEMTIRKAIETNADLLMATDPDADRLGVGYKTKSGEFELLNGNQTAAILTYYLLKNRAEKNSLKGNEMVVKTIVTSDVLSDIAAFYGVKIFDVLTGFKYIADIILKYEGQLEYVCGGEESYGFLAGDFIRDKDGVMTACLFAEATAWAASMGKTPGDLLVDIAVQFGLYREGLVSVTKKGMEGMQEISAMMDSFRNTIPQTMAGKKVVKVHDYKMSTTKNVLDGTVVPIHLPKSNVIQYLLEDGSKITMRPSGTEPKIKFYFSVKGKPKSAAEFEDQCNILDAFIQELKEEMGL
jgi:phosphoglucomutase